MNKANGYKCACREHYHLKSDNRTCLLHKCEPLQANVCPNNSYNDQYGNVCEPFIPTCSSLNSINGTCELTCKQGFKLATITPYKDTQFGENMSLISYTGPKTATCSSNSNVTIWNKGKDLSKLFCRRLNDPPKYIKLSRNTIPEFTPLYHNIGFFSASDDVNQTLTYTLDTHNKYLRIYNGILQNKLNVSLKTMQYKSALEIRVRATDNGMPAMSSVENFTIHIQNVNEIPVHLELSNNTVTSHTKVQSVVGTLSAIDPDISFDKRLTIELHWALIKGGEHFKIKSNKLMYIKEFGTTSSFVYPIKIAFSDREVPPLTSTKEFNIKYLAYTPPHIQPPNNLSLFENISVQSKVGKVIAYDNDKHSVTFIDISTADDDKGKFRVGASKCNIVEVKGQEKTQCVADLSKNLFFLHLFLENTIVFAYEEQTRSRLYKNQGRRHEFDENLSGPKKLI